MVIAVAPGAYVYQETCAQVIHYRNASAWRDFVPRIDQEGAKRSKETIANIQSHPESAFFDHQFQSLTYREYLRERLEMFLNP